MPLSPEQRAACERAGVEEVRAKMAYAGPGDGAVVPGLGDGLIIRKDVACWIKARLLHSNQACGASASISEQLSAAPTNGGAHDDRRQLLANASIAASRVGS
jgi:hypothetical protein